jgi:uncharacterized protein YjiS (DUF1127 family)
MKSENLHLSQVHVRAGLLGTLHSLQESFSHWQRRARERSELAQLDDLTKRDLGLSDSDISREASKYSWQA